MKNKRLMLNMISNILSFVISMAISFVLTPYIVRTIGKEAYGFVPLANNFIGYITIIVMALNSMASRFITIEIRKKDYEKANTYFSSVLFSNIIMVLVLIIPMGVFIVFIDKFLSIPSSLLVSVKLLFTFIFAGFLISLITSGFGIATVAKDRIDLRSYGDIIVAIIRALLTILLFSFLEPSIAYIGIVSVVTGLVAFVINLFLTKKLLPEFTFDRKHFSKGAVKELVTSGIWNSVNQLSVVLLSGLNLLIANIFLGSDSSGDYSIAQTIPTFIATLIGVIAGVFIPRCTYKYADNNIEGFINEVKNANKILGIIINVPIALFIVFGKDFYRLWVPGQSYGVLQIVSLIIMVPMIISGSIAILYNVFTITNKLRLQSFILLLSGVINVVVVAVLLKTTNLGLFAIPLANAVLSILRELLFLPIYASKCLEIKWNTFYPEIFKSILGVTCIIGIASIVKYFTNINSWVSFFIICSVCGIIGLFVNSVIVLNKEDIKGIRLSVEPFLRKAFNK